MRTHRHARLAALACILAATAAPAAAAGSGLDPRFRADEGGTWALRDNPALLGTIRDDVFMGLSYAPLAPDAGEGEVDLLAGAGGLALDLRIHGGDSYVGFAAAIPFSPALALGYRLGAWDSEPSALVFDLGAVIRPCGELSLGLTYDDALSGAGALGLGAALRPLAFLGEAGAAFAITADARFEDGALALESLGASLALGALRMRGWWDVADGFPGAELAVALGGEAGLRFRNPLGTANDARARLAMGFDLPAGPAAAVGKRIVLVKDLERISAAPLPPSPLRGLLGEGRSADLASLVRLVKAAAADRSVVALALEDLPALDGFAAPQELAAALAAFKAEGKKLYVFASDYGSATNYQYLAAGADAVVLDPNGGLVLEGLGSKRLYMKSALARLGIEFVNLAPWETKSANNHLSFDAMPEPERAMMSRLLGDLQDQADGALAAARAPKLAGEAAELVAAGPYLVSKAAVAAGLADSLMYKPEFEEWLEAEHPRARLDAAYEPREPRAWGPSLLEKKAVVLALSGSIVEGEGQAGISIGSRAAEAIAELREDRSVDAILLRVDSPGGSAATSDLVAREVELAAKAGKLVVVSMGNYAASGGYYVSAAASRIFASPGTLTGSIGVTGAVPNVAGALAKLGLSADGVATSGSADFLDVTASFDEADLERMRERIVFVYDRFVDAVARGRGMSAEAVRKIGEGQVWTGREALERGLVDELGGLAEAEDYVRRTLGGRVAFEERFPGEVPGLAASLASAAAGLGSGALAAPGSAEAALASAASAIAEALGPAASRAAAILAMGSGPLLYAEGIEDLE